VDSSIIDSRLLNAFYVVNWDQDINSPTDIDIIILILITRRWKFCYSINSIKNFIHFNPNTWKPAKPNSSISAMVSELLITGMALLTRFGALTGVLPVNWNPVTFRLVQKRRSVFKLPWISMSLTKHIITVQIFPMFYLCVQMVNTAYLILFFCFGNPGLMDIVLSCIVLLILCDMAFVNQLNYFFNFGNMAGLINAFMDLEEIMCKYK